MREITPRKPLHFLVLGIALLYIAVLLLAPIVTIVQKALANGFQPVITSLSEPNVIHALQVTFVMTLGAVLLNTVFGIIIAWVLTRQRFRGRRFLNILVNIPFVFSPVIAGYSLIVLFGRDGWLHPLLSPLSSHCRGYYWRKHLCRCHSSRVKSGLCWQHLTPNRKPPLIQWERVSG